MPAMKNALTIIRGTAPAFSGVTGQIDHRAGPLTGSGKNISEAGSLRVGAIWIAVSVLADECASLAMRLVERGDLTRTPQQPAGLRALWSDEPNPDQTHFGIEASEVMSMALWGFSATYLNWTNARELATRWPIDPSHVTLERTERGGMRLKYPGRDDLVNEPDERPQFEFIPLYNLPGQLMPVSPVRMAAELAGLSLAYEETAARFMGQGLNPSAVLMAGEPVEEVEAERLGNRLSRLHGGSGKAGKVAVLGGKDLKLERLSMSMADAQMIEQYDEVFKILLAFWRVPPTVAGMVDKPSTWGTGVAEFSRGLERFTLRPLVIRRQQAHQKFITKWVDPKLQVKYMFDSLLSASPKERAEIQRMRLTNGMTSIERILAQEDDPPFGEEETVYSQLAFATDEERRLEMLQRRAKAAAELVRAGVEQAAAFTAVGIDPETFTPVEEGA